MDEKTLVKNKKRTEILNILDGQTLHEIDVLLSQVKDFIGYGTTYKTQPKKVRWKMEAKEKKVLKRIDAGVTALLYSIGIIIGLMIAHLIVT